MIKKSCGLCCTKIYNLGVTLGHTKILENVNLHIHCGDFTAIVGPNGAGKSTLLKAILGEIPHTGKLRYCSSTEGKCSGPLIGYVPQQLHFDRTSPISVYDFLVSAISNSPVSFIISKKCRSRVIEILKRVQAEHLIDKNLGKLSGGELQRVLLALALDPIPGLLLLDEPISGVDQSGKELFYDLLSTIRKDYDLSILLISHDFDLVAKYANRVLFLNNTTSMSYGKPQNVFANPKFIEVFGDSWQNLFNNRGGLENGNNISNS